MVPGMEGAASVSIWGTCLICCRLMNKRPILSITMVAITARSWMVPLKRELKELTCVKMDLDSWATKAVFRHELRVKTRRFGDRVYPVAFHTYTTRREVFCTVQFTIAPNPPHYSGERWSSRVPRTEAGSDVSTPLRRSRDHVHSTPTTQTVLTSSTVSSMCVSLLFNSVFDIFASAVC